MDNFGYRTIRAYADGSYSKETGSVGVGVKIITPENNVCYYSHSIIGLKSSQEAEYLAQFEAASIAYEHYADVSEKILYLFTDCMWVKYAINHNTVPLELLDKWNIYKILRRFSSHITKSRNKGQLIHMAEVDALAKMEMELDRDIILRRIK